MIRDLTGAGDLRLRADVLVIGAGTAGLVLAVELARCGRRVICLESGGKDQPQDTHPLNTVEQIGDGYAGAEHGRFRCLGGTSTRWGGALIPFQAADIASADWPVIWDDLSPYLPRVEALFGLPEGPYEDWSMLPGSDYVARLAKWPRFRMRNVYTLLRNTVESDGGPEIWLNATATNFRIEEGRLTEVTARTPDGSRICVAADEVVIAAGAIESTRLLLLLDRQNGGCLSRMGPHLGKGFHDHLSTPIAEIVPKDRATLNRLVGFRFSPGGGMRNLRFELSPASGLRHTVAPCFAHVAFTHTEGGFSALRDVFRALQRRQLPSLSILMGAIRDLPWLIRAVVWKLVRRRLLFPDAAKLELHMVIEQSSRAENRICLSDRYDDPYGQPLARIDWKVDAEDKAGMQRAATAFAGAWRLGPLAGLADLVPYPHADVFREMAAGGGIYHPGGTTRMAKSPAGGVVDPDLRVFGLANVSVCSTSVLPTGGGANPTMMLLLLTMRCADGFR